jgi:predicted Fe-Mo cluster-binding NifX family protein
MIIIITLQQAKIDDAIEHRFGRSPYLVKVETETNQWEAFENPGVGQSGGAGIAAAQFVIDQKAQAVISGEFGPNAVRALDAAGVKMIRFPDGAKTGSDILQLIQQGELQI